VEVISELQVYFASEPDPDYITFSGAGEPTLNSAINSILKFIKENRPRVPVAVLTNGSLLCQSVVRKDLLDADVVLPSLDAAREVTFRRMNRPVPGMRMEDYLQGLINFRKEFMGQIWLEILILPGYNDHPDDLTALRNTVMKIKPDRIQLNTLDRPGVVRDLKSASYAQLSGIAKSWELDNIDIIQPATARKREKSYRSDVENAIMETLARRPCTVEDLEQIIGKHINEVNKYIALLEREGKVEVIRLKRGIFYRLKESPAQPST
jgi:wyosine [tRNA(Phe)-imidazoG37] synthetase (radical SAM superfamily)